MYLWGFNIYYFLFMIPGLLITLWAQIKMKSTYKKYKKVDTLRGLTGAQAARMILDGRGLHSVEVRCIGGNLSDNYDPRGDVLNLSPETYEGATVAAVGVAAHECGHAIQHAEKYVPSKLRSALVPVTNIGTRFSIPLIFIGFLLGYSQLVYGGIALFSLAVVFQLVTLPVELNASRRAAQILEGSSMVTPEEGEDVRKVLNAAALTYVAALLTSLLQLLYFVTLAGRRRN